MTKAERIKKARRATDRLLGIRRVQFTGNLTDSSIDYYRIDREDRCFIVRKDGTERASVRFGRGQELLDQLATDDTWIEI